MEHGATRRSASRTTEGTDEESISWDELSESRQGEMPIVRYVVPADSSDGSQPPMFKREASGLLLIPANDFDALLSDNERLRRSLEEQRVAASSTVAKPMSEQLTAFHYETLLGMMREKQALTERLTRAEVDFTTIRAEAQQLHARLQSTGKVLTERIQAYHRQQIKVDTLLRVKKLFTKSVAEVHQAQCKLRQPRLHPKAAKSCLNCGTEGHSWGSCPRKDTGVVFCHICNATGFTTEDCPGPHYQEYIDNVTPLSLRCKTCRRLLTEPDPTCGPCRKRIIDQAVKQRLDSPSNSRRSNGKPKRRQYPSKR